jgi:hypothetical protein
MIVDFDGEGKPNPLLWNILIVLCGDFFYDRLEVIVDDDCCIVIVGIAETFDGDGCTMY